MLLNHPNIHVAIDAGGFHLVPCPQILIEKELFQMHKHLSLQRQYHIQHIQVQDTCDKRKETINYVRSTHALQG